MRLKNKFFCKKTMLFFVLGMLLFFAFPLLAKADTGPKPDVTVLVQHPPDGVYYLDMLVPPEAQDTKGINLRNLETYDAQKISLLQNYQEDGWIPALVHGTKAPIWGDLIGQADGEQMRHVFSYYGIPNQFRLILITPDNQVVVTPVIQKHTEFSTIIYDYETGAIHQRSLVASYFLQFASTFLPTLIIEGALLFAFRYPLRRNWLVILITNFATQLFLTAVFGVSAVQPFSFFSLFIFIPVEAAIWLAESLVYWQLLRGQSRKRSIIYALTANAASTAWGILIIYLEAAFRFL